MKLTSKQHWDAACRAGANRDSAAAHILPTLTKTELQTLIAKRPEMWARYSAWLATLPETR